MDYSDQEIEVIYKQLLEISLENFKSNYQDNNSILSKIQTSFKVQKMGNYQDQDQIESRSEFFEQRFKNDGNKLMIAKYCDLYQFYEDLKLFKNTEGNTSDNQLLKQLKGVFVI